MNLYNLFESIILEEVQKQRRILTEGVSDDAIIDTLENRYEVWVDYKDDDNSPRTSRRYLQVYVYGVNKAGNRAIRAYQSGGQSTNPNGVTGWKTFRTDRIVNWTPTKKKWWNPVSDYDSSIEAYNQTGDDSFISIIAQVDSDNFNRKRSDIRQKPVEPVGMTKPEKPTQQPIKKAAIPPMKPVTEPVQKGKVEPAKAQPTPAPAPAKPAPAKPVVEPNNAEEEI